MQNLKPTAMVPVRPLHWLTKSDESSTVRYQELVNTISAHLHLKLLNTDIAKQQTIILRYILEQISLKRFGSGAHLDQLEIDLSMLLDDEHNVRWLKDNVAMVTISCAAKILIANGYTDTPIRLLDIMGIKVARYYYSSRYDPFFEAAIHKNWKVMRYLVEHHYVTNGYMLASPIYTLMKLYRRKVFDANDHPKIADLVKLCENRLNEPVDDGRLLCWHANQQDIPWFQNILLQHNAKMYPENL